MSSTGVPAIVSYSATRTVKPSTPSRRHLETPIRLGAEQPRNREETLGGPLIPAGRQPPRSSPSAVFTAQQPGLLFELIDDGMQ